jgi:hypothetical protein
MADIPPISSFDTSFLINLEVNYPIDLFPAVWEKMDEFFAAKKGYIIDLVSAEIEKKDDKVHEWISHRAGGIVKRLTDEELLKAQEILAKFPYWIDVQATLTSADPFVVANAFFSGATVVTHEAKVQIRENTRKIKIPNACEAFGVRSIHTNPGSSVFTEFFREQGWRF